MNTISVILKEYWGIFKSYIKEGGNYDKSNGNVIKSDKKKRKCDKVVIKEIHIIYLILKETRNMR